MFRKTRIKIVALIMTILVLIWVSTLGFIYACSFIEMRDRNEKMMQAHSQMYILSASEVNDKYEKPRPFKKNDFDPHSPSFQLSTFYSVALSYENEVLEIRNDRTNLHSNSDLVDLAQEIIKSDTTSGSKNNLSFYKEDKSGYMLVTFMDNTVINENVLTLFRYTFIFGICTLIVFFILAIYFSKKIVQPLEETYQNQKQFISDASHELKTPISVISANAEILSNQLKDNKWVDNIQYENDKMANLVKQLLDLAKSENSNLEMERIDFSHLVYGEILPLETVVFEKGYTLNSNIDENIYVKGNSSQLKQLVSILLDNAISHSSEKAEIKVNLNRESHYAKLAVINRGEEIPLEMREKIFERFYKCDSSHGENENNYGLGLAIAKAIVNSHKGKIEVNCYEGLVEFSALVPLKN